MPLPDRGVPPVPHVPALCDKVFLWDTLELADTALESGTGGTRGDSEIFRLWVCGRLALLVPAGLHNFGGASLPN